MALTSQLQKLLEELNTNTEKAAALVASGTGVESGVMIIRFSIAFRILKFVYFSSQRRIV